MNKSNHFKYSTFVWLTSAFIGSFLLCSFLGLKEGDFSNFSLIPFVIGFSLIFSFCNWLLLILFVWRINKQLITLQAKKSYITTFSICLTIVLFAIVTHLLGEGNDSEVFYFSIPYIIMLFFGIWFYELKPPQINLENSYISSKVKVLEDILDDEKY